MRLFFFLFFFFFFFFFFFLLFVLFCFLFCCFVLFILLDEYVQIGMCFHMDPIVYSMIVDFNRVYCFSCTSWLGFIVVLRNLTIWRMTCGFEVWIALLHDSSMIVLSIKVLFLVMLPLVNSCDPYRWCNGEHAQLECGRSWVRAPVESNQRLYIQYTYIVGKYKIYLYEL
jgi:hypothetical protein